MIRELDTLVSAYLTLTELFHFSAEKPSSRPGSRQGSLESSSSKTGGQRPTLTKQKSADDWLGLGDENPINDSKHLSKSSTLPIPNTNGEFKKYWLCFSSFSFSQMNKIN